MANCERHEGCVQGNAAVVRCVCRLDDSLCVCGDGGVRLVTVRDSSESARPVLRSVTIASLLPSPHSWRSSLRSCSRFARISAVGSMCAFWFAADAKV